MTELINLFPTILLGVMIVLTLVLLPLLSDDAAPRREAGETDRQRFRQRTDEIRVPISDERRER